MTQAIKQAIITSKDSLDASSATERLALFDDSGEPYTGFKDVADLVTPATAIGTAAKTTTGDEPTAGTIVRLSSPAVTRLTALLLRLMAERLAPANLVVLLLLELSLLLLPPALPCSTSMAPISISLASTSSFYN